jgi:hypothetical protein
MISAALPTSSEPFARRPTPFAVVGSGEKENHDGRKFFVIKRVYTEKKTPQKRE